MDTHPTPDEPPAAAAFRLLSFVLVPLFLVACHQPQKKKTVVLVPKKLVKDTVAIVKKDTPPKTGKKKKKVYLTFDDGPNNGTSNVLNIVKEENIPVTFFLIGQHAFASRGQQANWDSLQAMAQIELCNHSFTHAWHNKYNKFYESPDSVISDFEKTKEMLGLNNKIARAPGRNAWRIDSLRFTDNQKSRAAVDSLQKAGYTIVGWDLEWHFDPRTMNVTHTADELVKQIDSLFAKKRTRSPDNLVLLAHDQAYKNAADSSQLHQLIKKLKQKEEYEFAIVSSYPGVSKPRSDSSRRDSLVKGIRQ